MVHKGVEVKEWEHRQIQIQEGGESHPGNGQHFPAHGWGWAYQPKQSPCTIEPHPGLPSIINNNNEALASIEDCVINLQMNQSRLE